MTGGACPRGEYPVTNIGRVVADLGHPRQFGRPQGKGGPICDPRRQRPRVVPALLLAPSQPDRADLCKDKALAARCSETNRRRNLAPARRLHRHNPTRRTPQLHPRRRIRFRLKRMRSRICLRSQMKGSARQCALCVVSKENRRLPYSKPSGFWIARTVAGST